MDPVSKAQQPENRRKTGFTKGNKLGRKFQPGQSGNAGGRPKKHPITELLAELFEDPKTREQIKNRARITMTSRGMAGVLLLRESAERIEGKVAQPVEMEVSGKVTLEQVLEAKKKAGK